MMHHPGGYEPNAAMGRAAFFAQPGHPQDNRVHQPPQLKILERRAPDAWHQPVGVMGGRAGHYDSRFMPTLRQVAHSLANSASPMELAQQNEKENKNLNATPGYPDGATQHGRKRRASSELLQEKRGRILLAEGNVEAARQEAPRAGNLDQGFGHQSPPDPMHPRFNEGQVHAHQPSSSGAARNGASPIEMLERLVTLDEAPAQAKAPLQPQAPAQQPVENLPWGYQPNGHQVPAQDYLQGAAGDAPPLFQANYPQHHIYQNPMYGQHQVPGHNPYLNMVGQYVCPPGAQGGPQLWQPFLFQPNQPHPMEFNPIHGQMFANQGHPNLPHASIHEWCDLWQSNFVDSNWWAR